MVNVVLKFVQNPKNDGKVVGFFRKKICFVLNGSELQPKEGEIWECFLWADRKRFFLVKPFKQVTDEKFEDAQKRVDQFNQELFLLEKKQDADLTKLVYHPETNKPYLRSQKNLAEAKRVYQDWVVREVEVSGEKQVWVRPIMNADDRKEWRENQ